LWEEYAFIAIDIFVSVKTMKAGKAADCDEIGPKMLKSLNREGVLWLTRSYQVA